MDKYFISGVQWLIRQNDLRLIRASTDQFYSSEHTRKKSVIWILSLIVGSLLITGGLSLSHQFKELFFKKIETPIVHVDPELVSLLPAGARYENEKLLYTCSGNETVSKLTHLFYDFSEIFIYDEFMFHLKEENLSAFKNSICQQASELSIPQPLYHRIKNAPLGWSIDEPVRALYLRGENTKPSRLIREVEHLKNIRANGIVFDIKDIVGNVNYKTNLPDVERYRVAPPPILSLPKSIKFLHQNGIYAIARIALFQDENMARKKPEWGPYDANSPTGRILIKGRPLWLDPGNDEVQEYNLQIIRELAKFGIDEVQFDYIRYPAEGNLSGVTYNRVNKSNDKIEHLTRFLRASRETLAPYGTHTSIDIFGVVAWGEELDVQSTGQRIEELAKYTDIISPMLYPSHFNEGFDGYEKPADHGYHFYFNGVQKVLEKSQNGVVVRPWIQAFRWRVTNYNEQYIIDQIKGNRDAGGRGWMMWNAGNNYDMVYRALRNAPIDIETLSGSAAHKFAPTLFPDKPESRPVSGAM